MKTKTKIKICGLRRFEDICCVNEYVPDYIGFVFAESKRKVTMEEAALLKKELREEIQAVGVFVNEQISNIVSLCEQGIIDMIQLHGDETKETVQKLKQETGKPIIKAVRVQSTQLAEQMKEYPSDFLLFDSYERGSYGGTGKAFRHEMLPQGLGKFFLAGGLNERNVLEAIKSCSPYAVDLSSGVESNGFKDAGKIKAVTEKIRTAL